MGAPECGLVLRRSVDGMEGSTAGERIAAFLHRVWRRGVMRSGVVTWVLLAVLTATFVLAYRQHVQGNFHKLKERMAEERPQVAAPKPGGEDVLLVTRARLMDESVPEFLGVSLLPGRGMNVLQIRAYIPGKGEVELMASPSLREAAAAMTGRGADANGDASLRMGGAFTIPWADRIWAGEGAAGHAVTAWQGRDIVLPAVGPSAGAAGTVEGGLMLATASDASNTATLPDGGQAEATFNGFGEGWPSTSRVHVTALLSSHTVDLTVTVENTGKAAEPIGIGWMPRFAVLPGTAPDMRLRIPADSRVEFSGRGVPTGKLLPVDVSAFDNNAREGAKLPTRGLDECLTDLEQGVFDNGPVAELSDVASGYQLRLTALSPQIRAMRVVIPPDGSYVTIGPQFNYPDPFGREWDKYGGSGVVVLEPGQSTEWKVRLEILPLNGSGSDRSQEGQ